MAIQAEMDHSVLAVNDLELGEHFYARILGQVLGGSAERRTMGTTDEIIRAGRLRAVQAERRGGDAFRVPAPHSGVHVGRVQIPLFLYSNHVQEPPPEQLRGTPRLAMHVSPAQMDELIEVLQEHKVAFEGPVDHPAPCPVARSVYLKDPSSNFLELAVPRDGS